MFSMLSETVVWSCFEKSCKNHRKTPVLESPFQLSLCFLLVNDNIHMVVNLCIFITSKVLNKI